ncbi:MAG: hypothetical protein COB46_02690 [Rhodospirillaceae bacterium]|nr:MAG: hypothetical protein COB46_02690 [Rhodospirillaceae bacterium]
MLSFVDWKISYKIQSIVATIVVITMIGSAVAFSNVKNLGYEIQGIAERDMPLVAALTEIEINQLEQAISFEKILRLSGHGKGTAQDLKAVEANFTKYGTMIAKEVDAVRELIAKSLKADHLSALEKDELTRALAQVEIISKEHKIYDHTVQKAIEQINAGAEEQELTGIISTIEHEQEKLITEITGLLTEIDRFTAKALLTAEHDEIAVERTLMISALLTLVLGVGIGTLIGRSISRPVQGMTEAMKTLSEGNANVDVPAQGRKDEVGEMALSVQVFKDNLIKNQEMAKQAEADQAERDRRVKLRDQITAAFDNDVTSMLKSVNVSTQSMDETAQSMSAIAEQSLQQSSAVAAASEEASVNVQTVASASEELAASITEISRQVSQSTTIAGTAVVEVENTNSKIQGLAEAANKIGEVVAMITDIADQTNLLALNATIEAARAGDAGKGFAVVASEVKNLANQTAKATEEISLQISGVQGATQEAVTAIGSIGGTINELNEISSAIAAAVEEQGAATQEIARNVEQAAQGTADVSSNIEGVRQAAGETGTASTKVLEVSRELGEESETLSKQVEKFLNDIKQA